MATFGQSEKEDVMGYVIFTLRRFRVRNILPSQVLTICPFRLGGGDVICRRRITATTRFLSTPRIPINYHIPSAESTCTIGGGKQIVPLTSSLAPQPRGAYLQWTLSRDGDVTCAKILFRRDWLPREYRRPAKVKSIAHENFPSPAL